MWTYVVWFVVNNFCLDFKRRKSQRFLGKITTSVYVFLKIFVVHRIFISKLDGYKKFVFSITNFNNQKLDFPASYKKLKIWGHRRWLDWGWCKIFCMKRGRKRNESAYFLLSATEIFDQTVLIRANHGIAYGNLTHKMENNCWLYSHFTTRAVIK